MSKIKIMSTQTIVVTPDLKIKDLTDPHSMAPNKLRAVVDWDDEPVKVLIGTHEYDAKIKNWQSVQALVKAEIFSITDIVEIKKEAKEEKIVEKIKKEEIKKSRLEEISNE